MAMMGLITFVVILVILFFDTPYKRQEAEVANTASNPPSISSSSHSLTATSGYASTERASATGTSSSRSSADNKKSRMVVPQVAASEYGEEEDTVQSRLWEGQLVSTVKKTWWKVFCKGLSSVDEDD